MTAHLETPARRSHLAAASTKAGGCTPRAPSEVRGMRVVSCTAKTTDKRSGWTRECGASPTPTHLVATIACIRGTTGTCLPPSMSVVAGRLVG